jgi:DNA-binding XRE family transcriptional regulator
VNKTDPHDDRQTHHHNTNAASETSGQPQSKFPYASVPARRSPNITPLPGPGIVSELTALIDARVDVKMRELGVTIAMPDPRALRIQRGLTQVELAGRAGLSHAAIGRIENGQTRRPAPATLDKIARALGIPESEYRKAVAALLQRTGGAA